MLSVNLVLIFYRQCVGAVGCPFVAALVEILVDRNHIYSVPGRGAKYRYCGD